VAKAVKDIGSGEFEGVYQDTIVGDGRGVVDEKDGVGRGVSGERVCACWGVQPPGRKDW